MSVGFLERSRLERGVIALVNCSAPEWPQLNGLSSAAIDKWAAAASVGAQTSGMALSKVESLLKEVSQRISSNSDSSKHVFVGEVFSPNSTVDICIEELRKALKGVQSPAEFQHV